MWKCQKIHCLDVFPPGFFSPSLEYIAWLFVVLIYNLGSLLCSGRLLFSMGWLMLTELVKFVISWAIYTKTAAETVQGLRHCVEVSWCPRTSNSVDVKYNIKAVNFRCCHIITIYQFPLISCTLFPSLRYLI